jgi:TM2 domain-containing membrane protein YozV
MKKIIGIMWWVVLIFITIIIVILSLITTLISSNKFSDWITKIGIKISDVDKKMSKYYNN